MQADSHSNVTVSREQNRYDGIIPLVHNNRIIRFIHSCFYSWVLGVVNIFQPHLPLHSWCPIRTRSWAAWAPCFADCHRKGQPSFNRRRMGLLVPHPPQRVHKNLHNSSRKCQYIDSMAIRRFQHYSCLPHCDLESQFQKSWNIV